MLYFGIPIRNGLPIGLGSVAGFGIAPFSPESLFENGEQGAWYDPSDYSTLFTDSAGTTPVTAVEQFVGLMLDKSKGLVLGPELVTNGDFSSGTTGWTGINSTLAVVGGAVEITATVSAQARASQAVTTVSGRWYEARATIWQGTGAVNVDLLVSGIASSAAVSSTTPTAVVVRFLATSSSTTIRVGSAGSAVIGTTFFADNISVRELPGNHAFQTSSAKRPKLAARYNLLTYSEEFDNGAWTKTGFLAFGSGSVANTTATLDPIGGNTADLIVENNANSIHATQSLTIAGSANTSYTLSRYIKNASGSRWFLLGINEATSNAVAFFHFQPSTNTQGVVGVTSAAWSGATAQVTSLPNGWYRVSLTATLTSAANISDFSRYKTVDNGPSSYAGDGTSGMYHWGADLRPASQATGLIGPTYQRVAAATVYDTAGFLPYLAFDGLDDSMSTNSIDFSATDKMTVFSGWRRLANGGVTLELSSAVASNAGSFYVFAGDRNLATGARWTVSSRGTAADNANQAVETAANYSAPLTNLVTGLFDISGDLTTLRINGAQVGTATGDQGTGNFGNYPLYIGMRNNASLPFTGWLTSLIIRGAQSTQSQIEATEAWVNGKTGAY
jgi:hypothetical protein